LNIIWGATLDLLEVVRLRRSIRKFKSEKVPRDVVRSLLDLARWSPSAHNTQPWRFVVIDDEAVKGRLAKEMGKVWVSDIVKDGVDRDEAERMVKTKNWNRITASPVVLIACLDLRDLRRYPDSRRRKVEHMIAVQSVAACIQTLLLTAYDHKLGACWVCTPLYCQNGVRRVLGLPKEIEPQAMIIMGFADEEPSAPGRKSLDEICVFNRWAKAGR
jgi:coenzyme F420-0:L-glutamate ligase/coenzyme F420-1:gamma-L-glutamate ligase